MKVKQAKPANAAARPGAIATAPRGESLLAWCGLIVLLLALAGPLLTLPVFGRGFLNIAEPVVIAGFGLGGIGALLLALWLLGGGRPDRRVLLLALPAAALALWLLLAGQGGMVVPDWRLRLMGNPETGFGALWYAVLAIWLLLADLLRRHAQIWRLLFWGALLCAAGTALLLVATLVGEWTGGRLYGFRVPAFYGWAGLMLPVLACSLLPGPVAAGDKTAETIRAWLRRHAALLLALLVGFLLLALSRAITLLGAGMIGVFVALLWHWLPQQGWLAWLRRPPLIALMLAGAALGPLLLLSLPELAGLAPSLESRRLTWLMAWAELRQQPLIWLLGQGAGTAADVMATQLASPGVPLWDVERWDALLTDYFHFHNWLPQGLIDGGLPAVLLLAWLLLLPFRLAAVRLRGVALGFSLAYLLALGLWMEFLPVLAYLALAWIALLPPPESRPGPLPPLWRGPLLAACLLVAVAGLWSAWRLEDYARQADMQMAWLLDASESKRPVPEAYRSGPLPPPPAYPADPRRHDVQAADLLFTMSSRFVRRHDGSTAGPVDPVRDNQRLAWLIEIIRNEIDRARTPRFAIHAARLLSEIAVRPDQASLRPQVLAQLPLWRHVILRAQQVAPRRHDVALGYMVWSFGNGRRDETLRLARELRRQDADHPVALFYEGAVLVQEDDAARKQQGLALMRRALALGLEQYFAVDAGLKQFLGMP